MNLNLGNLLSTASSLGTDNKGDPTETSKNSAGGGFSALLGQEISNSSFHKAQSVNSVGTAVFENFNRVKTTGLNAEHKAEQMLKGQATTLETAEAMREFRDTVEKTSRIIKSLQKAYDDILKSGL